MKIFIVVGLLVFVSCTSRQETTSGANSDSLTPIKSDTTRHGNPEMDVANIVKEKPLDSCQWIDLTKKITPAGNYIAYERFDNFKYRIVWGNKNLKRILADTLYCDAPPVAKPHFEKENKNYIMLRFGCGSSCWGSIYLPLNTYQKVTRVYYEYATDLDHHLVAALALDETKTFIAVHNLKTSKVQEIKLEKECESAIPTYCLDSLSIIGKNLYFRWTADASFKSKNYKEYTVKIR